MPKILVNYKYNKKEDSFKVLNYVLPFLTIVKTDKSKQCQNV